MPNNLNNALSRNRKGYFRTVMHEFQDMNNRQAGRELCQRRPDLWKTPEAGRTWYRDQQVRPENKGLNYDFADEIGLTPKKSTIAEGLAKLRKYEATKAQPLQLTGKVLVLSDIHLPFHDEGALSVALNAGAEYEPDVVVLNGDIMDCHAISRWSKEVNRPSFVDELEVTREFLFMLRELFPTARIIYKEGNHEERIRNYILQNARDFADLQELTLSALLRMPEFGVEPVGREIIKLGKLNLMHGHELGEGVFSPVNPARGFFLKAKCNAMIGHYHASSHHSEGNLNGDRIGVWSLGSLCRLDPDYRPFAFTKWNHGFAFVEVMEDGQFHVENKSIINGRAV